MPTQYRRPPLVEALIEFRFPSSISWDLTIPGQLYERLKPSFPHKEQRLGQEIDLVQGPQGLEQKIISAERILFMTENRNQFVQIGRQIISVNCLQPYPGWHNFEQSIQTALQAIEDVIKFEYFQRIGLRYINRIVINEAVSKIEALNRYFNFKPTIANNFPSELKAFISGCIFSINNNLCKVELNDSSQENESTNVFILDIDYYTPPNITISKKHSRDWINEAHISIEQIFEATITPELRLLFEAE